MFTVRDKKWNGLKNGELLKKLIQEDFQVLITFDKNLEFQQNFSKLPITVLTIKAEDNTYLTLNNYISSIKKILKEKFKAWYQGCAVKFYSLRRTFKTLRFIIKNIIPDFHTTR